MNLSVSICRKTSVRIKFFNVLDTRVFLSVFLRGELIRVITVVYPSGGVISWELHSEDIVSLKNGFVNTIGFVIDDLGKIKGDKLKFFFGESFGFGLGGC